MDNVLKTHGVLDKYTIDRPTPQLRVRVITDSYTIAHALGPAGAQDLRTPYAKNIHDVKLDKGFLAVIDDPVSFAKATTLLKHLVVPSPTDLNQHISWFHARTMELIRDKSLTLADPSKHTVDLVKDIFRLVPVHWSSSQVVSLLSNRS